MYDFFKLMSNTPCTAIITNITLYLTIVIPLKFIHLTLTAPLEHSQPNPSSIIKNIDLIFVSSLGIVKSPWKFSSYNRSFQDSLLCILPSHRKWSTSNLKGILIFLQIFINMALILFVGFFQAYCPISMILSILNP